MAAGINELVEQKVNAYRGNPQQLMQRYQQNQELVDLLALQKMKSEKEAAARDMQMKMQQNPQTIAQQREQEVLGLTKNELAQQTAGIMQQRQKQQQQGLQRMAKAAGGAPGGLAGLAPQGARPAPRRMAGGGIVAFQEGGSTDRAALEARKEELLKRLRYRRNDREASEELLRINEQLASITAGTMGGAFQQMAGMAPPTPAAPEPAPTPAPRAAPTPTPTSAPKAGGLGGLSAGREFFPGPDEAAATAKETPLGAGDITGVSMREPEAGGITAPAAPDISPYQGVRKGMEAGLAGIDVGGMEDDAIKKAGDLMRREQMRGRAQDRLTKLEGMEEKLYDPESERLDRLIAFATGAGGQATAAGALGAGAKSSLAMRQEQRKGKLDRAKQLAEMASEADLADVNISKSQLAAGIQAADRASTMRNSYVQAISTLSAAEMRSLEAQADRELRADIANGEIAARRAAAAAQEAAAVLRNESATAAVVGRALDQVTAALQGLEEDILANNPRYQTLSVNPEKNAEEIARIEQEAKKLAAGKAQALGLNDRLDRLEDRFYELTGSL